MTEENAMDPRVIKGMTVLAGICAYVLASHLDPIYAEYVRQLAALLVGGQAIRRAGDLPPADSAGAQ
jgi:hypothetical protein